MCYRLIETYTTKTRAPYVADFLEAAKAVRTQYGHASRQTIQVPTEPERHGYPNYSKQSIRIAVAKGMRLWFGRHQLKQYDLDKEEVTQEEASRSYELWREGKLVPAARASKLAVMPNPPEDDYPMEDENDN